MKSIWEDWNMQTVLTMKYNLKLRFKIAEILSGPEWVNLKELVLRYSYMKTTLQQ